MVQYGSIWFNMVQYGFIWFSMVQNGSIWLSRVYNMFFSGGMIPGEYWNIDGKLPPGND